MARKLAIYLSCRRSDKNGVGALYGGRGAKIAIQPFLNSRILVAVMVLVVEGRNHYLALHAISMVCWSGEHKKERLQTKTIHSECRLARGVDEGRARRTDARIGI